MDCPWQPPRLLRPSPDTSCLFAASHCPIEKVEREHVKEAMVFAAAPPRPPPAPASSLACCSPRPLTFVPLLLILTHHRLSGSM